MKRWSVALLAAALTLPGGYFVASSALRGQNAGAEKRPPQQVTSAHPSFRDVVKKVLPAVVSIKARGEVARVERRTVPTPKFDDRQIPEEFRRFFEDFRRGPQTEPNESPRFGFGSGFLVDPTGVVVTNYHVVAGADQATVELQDGRKFTAKKIRTDRRTDLAVLLLENGAKNLPYLELGDSDAMEIGDPVLAVGAPFGLAGTVTHGIVSAKGRNGLHMNMYEDFIQTDAAINPGNSGGPLVNMEGKVIGINAAIKTRSGGFQGVGLAITSNLARNVIESLRTNGVVHRGYLGVQIRDLDPAVAKRFGLTKDVGVVVGEVFEKTPAAKAGLKPGDIITALGGRPVTDGRQLQQAVAAAPIGKQVNLNILRDGKKETLPVTIEEQPREFGTAGVPAPLPPSRPTESVALDKLGVEVADLNDQQAEELGYRKGARGVVITKVQTGSIAAEGGLRRGMLITKVENRPVASADAARQALQNASLSRGVLLQVQSPQGGTNFVLLRSETK